MRVTTYNESLEVDSVIHIVMGKGQAANTEDVHIASQLIEQFGTQ